MTHYVIVAVNGSRTMRLGQVFNETVIYARQWVTVDAAKWWPLPGRRPTLRIMKHCQEMAHWWVYEEGQHVLLYQFTFRFHQYTAGTDSLAFSSASTVTVNPYCRCFTCKGCHLLVRKWLFSFFSFCFTSKRISYLAVHMLPKPSSWASWKVKERWTEYATEQNPH